MTYPPRRSARHAVLQALYAYMLGGDSPSHVYRTVLHPRLPEQDGARKLGIRLFEKVIAEQDGIDQIIADHARNWDLGRILKMDLIILRIAICEFLHFEQIPPKSTMNEAIEMAKIFSTEESKDFVNGVLDTIAFRLREEGKLVKSGGGMQGWDEMVNRQKNQRTS